MGRFTIPDAKAPEESTAAPAVEMAPVAAEPPPEPAVSAEPPPEPAVASAPVVRKAFETWAVELSGVVIDDRGKARGVQNLRRIPDGSRNAGFFNAARRVGRIPVGKTMTRVEYDAAIEAAKAIEIR